MSQLLYSLYRAHGVLVAPARIGSRLAAGLAQAAPAAVAERPIVRRVGAAGRVLADARLTHSRPAFVIEEPSGDGGRRQFTERTVHATPFGSLIHFVPEHGGAARPKVLLSAPLSGHFSTMLTPTIRTLLRDHDVFVTDWHNARDIPIDHGRFGLDDYVAHIIRFLGVLGPGAHAVAVCQPCVPALVASAVLAADHDPCEPRSLTLISGPIDTRVNPTSINLAAQRRPLDWYRKRCVTVVPKRYAGAGRRVYPGFLQVSAFMSLNLRRHIRSHIEMYRDLAEGTPEQAESTRQFYQEYFAVLDVPAEFYLDTVGRVFQEHELPLGTMTYRGRPVRPQAITRTALLTVEAEKDDLCAVGQTQAAHRIVSGLGPEQRGHYVQPGVGHYGIFSGRRWEAEVYPVVRDFIREHDDATRDYTEVACRNAR
jgi:poly(3-hydroxybutyrate) depolymerase